MDLLITRVAAGKCFLGGIRGLNAFHPDHIQENNPYLPPVALTQLTQGGEELNLGQTVNNVTEVTLNWPDNYFEFEFAALSYVHPEENQYAYMLEGLDDNWVEMGNRGYGRYTHLPGGTYTLRMIGSNNDAIWNEEGTLLKINVVPPFWETWWFRGAILLILVGGVIGGYQLRVRSVEARSRDLESQVVSRTKELAALNSVAAVVSRSLELQQVLTNALEKTLEIIEMEAGGIYLLQEDNEVLVIAAHQGTQSLWTKSITSP